MNIIKRIIPSKRKTFNLKQEALFHMALSELNIKINKFSINHKEAKCYNDGKEYSVIFPLSFFKAIKNLNGEKKYDYSFVGLYINDRKWVKEFEGENNKIIFSNNGRITGKTEFDKNYYGTIKASKFSLCPKGDFNWTYRFIESALCRSIPIIESKYLDPIMEGFIWYDYKDTANHIFDRQIVEHNYRLAVQRHSLLSEYLECI
jgi:hypothetical protein